MRKPRALVWRETSAGIERRCNHCAEWLPVAEFYRKTNGLLRSWCRQCYMAGVLRCRRKTKAAPIVKALQAKWGIQ